MSRASTCAAARSSAPRGPTRPSPRNTCATCWTTLRKLNVDDAGDDRRRRHGLFGQPGLPAGRRRHPRGPRAQDHRQRSAAARLDADVRLRDGPAPRRRHRAQPGRGRPHHVALVSDRQHGPGGRPPGAGHRQGGRRHAHHHPRGVPRPAGQHRRDVRHPHRLHHQAAQRQPQLRRRGAGRGPDRGHRREGPGDDDRRRPAGPLRQASAATTTATCAWATSSSAA